MKRKRLKRLSHLALSLAMGAGILCGQPITARASDYEAKIGEAYYEELEEAFANVKTGEVITVLRDCQVTKTLEITVDDVTLKSENSGSPVTISREEEFTGKSYGLNAGNVLLGISSGSLTTQDVILDGGAVLDDSFNNTGETWDSPLVYVKGAYTMEDGTVLKNNYSTDGSEANTGGRTRRTAGALHVTDGGSLTMSGGRIQDCYTLGAGGGIQAVSGSDVTITSGTISHCSGVWGGALWLSGPSEVSGMTLSDNSADSTGGAVYSESSLILSDCEIKDNTSDYDGGGVYVSVNYPVTITGCTITGNTASRGSAIQSSGSNGTEPITIKDCTITGNKPKASSAIAGAICYMQEKGIILDGSIVMEDNLQGAQPCDINFWYNDAAPIQLGQDFDSSSVFVIGSMNLLPEKLLVDAATNGIETDEKQFTWHNKKYRTIEKDGDIYLSEIPETYSITYDANNNEDGESATYTDPNSYTGEDTAVILDEAGISIHIDSFTKEGYDFAGWNTAKDGEGTDYSEGQEVNLTEDLYLYAKWEAKTPVTLTYHYNGGSGEKDSEQAVPGAYITFPEASRERYRFQGWYEDEKLTVYAGNAGERHYVPQQDTSYYAKWEQTEAVITFNSNGGRLEGESTTAKIGSDITLPACTKEDYDFMGWYDGDTCVGQAGEKYTVSKDVTLKARYEKKAEATFTITFDAGEGEMEGGSITAKAGDTVTLPVCTKEGYDFTGWFDDDVCVGQAGEKYTVTKNVTLKARYEKKTEITCTVTFDTDGGKEIAPVKATKGETIKLPAAEKENCRFLGWYTKKTGGILLGVSGDKLEVTKDMTVYALWEKETSQGDGDSEPETCKVVFHLNGGNLKNTTITVRKDAGIYLPLPEYTGYDFAGWYLDAKLTQCAGAYKDVYHVTKNTDFYAKWQKAEKNDTDQSGTDHTTGTYTIKYDANGGSVKESLIKAAKGASVKLPAAERENYCFLGWYTENKVYVGTTGDTYQPGRDITLYAGWEKTETGNNGTVKDPVIQTGRTSPLVLLISLGLIGAFLVVSAACRKGRAAWIK